MSVVIDDMKDAKGLWVATITTKDGRRVTRSRMYFNAMRGRCKEGGWAQKRRPAYQGCVDGFDSFQAFAEWANSQVGYGNDGWCLDKDILVKGNKIYSPENCIFVPYQINTAMLNNKHSRDDLPVGVARERDKFNAYVSTNGKVHRLGLFDTPLQAFHAYKTRKEEYIKELAAEYQGKIDDRAYAALMSYQVSITD